MKRNLKDDTKAILNLTANSFPDEVIHLSRNEQAAKDIFVSVENSYAKFVEKEVELALKSRGHNFINQDAMLAFMEANCNIRRDDTLPNPINVLSIGEEIICSWHDFADVIGHVSKN